MIDTSTTQFQVQQLRLKNVWKELEFISVIVMIIFVNGLLPQLLLQYVYANAELFETPQALQVIPVVSFVIGTLTFLYVGIGNLLRETQARRLEASMISPVTPTVMASSANTSQLQAAMKSLEARTQRTAVTRKPAKLVATRPGKSKKTVTRRKSK